MAFIGFPYKVSGNPYLQLLDEEGLLVGAHGGQGDGLDGGGGGGVAEGAPGHHAVALAAVDHLVVHQVRDGADLWGGRGCGVGRGVSAWLGGLEGASGLSGLVVWWAMVRILEDR